jgi:hypothetical protein
VNGDAVRFVGKPVDAKYPTGPGHYWSIARFLRSIRGKTELNDESLAGLGARAIGCADESKTTAGKINHRPKSQSQSTLAEPDDGPVGESFVPASLVQHGHPFCV